MEKKLRGTPRSNRRRYSYHTINLPIPLAEKINEALKSERVKHRNIPDFVKTAVEKLLHEIEIKERRKRNKPIKENDFETNMKRLKQALTEEEINLDEYLELKKLLEKEK